MVQSGGILGQKNGDRIGFFPGGASDNADPNLAICVLAFKQFRNHLTPERLEGLPIAKELRNADHQVLEKLVGFFRLALQDLDILPDVRNLQGLHAALQAPCKRSLLVLAAIMTGPSPQQAMYIASVCTYLLADTVRLAVERTQAGGIFDEFRRHLRHGQDMIDKACCDRAPENRVMLGGFKGLRHSQASMLFDRPTAARSIPTRA